MYLVDRTCKILWGIGYQGGQFREFPLSDRLKILNLGAHFLQDRLLLSDQVQNTRLVGEAVDDRITPVRKGGRETIVCRNKIDDRFYFSGKLITKIDKQTAIERPG